MVLVVCRPRDDSEVVCRPRLMVRFPNRVLLHTHMSPCFTGLLL
jgi:hypothetical protein